MTGFEIVTATAEQVVRHGMSDRECAVVERAITAIENIATADNDADSNEAIQQIAAVAVGVIRGAMVSVAPAPAAGGGS